MFPPSFLRRLRTFGTSPKIRVGATPKGAGANHLSNAGCTRGVEPLLVDVYQGCAAYFSVARLMPEDG